MHGSKNKQEYSGLDLLEVVQEDLYQKPWLLPVDVVHVVLETMEVSINIHVVVYFSFSREVVK